MGEEEIPSTRKGPSKDPEINEQLMKGFLHKKINNEEPAKVDSTTESTIEVDRTVQESDKVDLTEEKPEEVDLTEEKSDKVESMVLAEDEEQDPSEGEDSEVFLPDSSAVTLFELDVTSIGSSNMRNVVMLGDRDLKINFNNFVTRGMRISEAHERLDDIDDEDKPNILMMVVNVGACDFQYGESTDVLGLAIELGGLVEDIKYQCPETILIVSSVLPRSGKGTDPVIQKTTNCEIGAFIEHVHQNCDKLLDVHYVNNDLFAKDEAGNPIDDLYHDDVHLNREGKKKLSDSLFQTIKQVYFGRRLRKELLEEDFLGCRLRHVSELLEKEAFASA